MRIQPSPIPRPRSAPVHDLPLYPKLERHGSNFVAYASRDGANWGKELASHPSKLVQGPVRVGLCVTTSSNPTTDTATIDHVTVSSEPATN